MLLLYFFNKKNILRNNTFEFASDIISERQDFFQSQPNDTTQKDKNFMKVV